MKEGENMTVYEIPNIEHCDIEVVGNISNPIGYTIISNEGWYIHLNNDVSDTINVWKRAVVLPVDDDFSIVEIRAEAGLPEDAEICGGHKKEVTE